MTLSDAVDATVGATVDATVDAAVGAGNDDDVFSFGWQWFCW